MMLWCIIMQCMLNMQFNLYVTLLTEIDSSPRMNTVLAIFSFFGGINKCFNNISSPPHCEDQETDGKASFIINSLANTLEIDQS